MALYAPTNITPSLTTGFGNGVVDYAAAITVSWQVNGNSPMTGYRIDFYKNTASASAFYTYMRTNQTPFYNVDENGNINMFSVTIPSSAYSTHVTNGNFAYGNEYKIKITQYWGSGTSNSVVMPGFVAFITRQAPSVTWSNSTSTIASMNYEFEGAYSQAQGDAAIWTRWQIAYTNDGTTPSEMLYDSGEIYGASQMTATVDGLLNGNAYVCMFSAETQNGITVNTGWQAFDCTYATQGDSGSGTATKACGANAVKVSWDGTNIIVGEASGSYSISKGVLSLPIGTTITWDKAGTDALSLAAPWSVFYAGTLSTSNTNVFEIGQGDGDPIILKYENTSDATGTGKLALYQGTTLLLDMLGSLPYESPLWVVLTPTTISFRYEHDTGALYPLTSLYPDTALYPSSATGRGTPNGTLYINYTQEDITYIKISGRQLCNSLQIINSTATTAQINAIRNGTYAASTTGDTVFLTDFTNELNAGSAVIGGKVLSGWKIYRQDTSENHSIFLTETAALENTIYDYGAKSQHTYVYRIYPVSQTGTNVYVGITIPVETNEITPCFWDWTVMEVSQQSSNLYTPIAIYDFGKNLTSGSMSNNNEPYITQNFTAYPTVQLSPALYKSGTLQSLIGTIDYTAENTYSDTTDLRDAIFALAKSSNTLFLKNRKGDLMQIRISGAVTMETMDNTREQAQTVSLPWVEVADATGASITAKTLIES